MLHIVHLIRRRAGDPAPSPLSATGVKVVLALAALALAAGILLLAAR